MRETSQRPNLVSPRRRRQVMKIFITTKLHAVVSVSVQEQTVEVENGVDEEEEQVEEETAKKFVDGVVDLQSVASPFGSSPLLSSSSQSSVMTLNSPTSKHHRSLKNSISGDGGTSGGNNNSITTGMMTVVEVPPGGSPQLVHQQQQQKQHAMMGQPISGGGGSTTTTTTIAPTAAQVKMSGYLKKKRNVSTLFSSLASCFTWDLFWKIFFIAIRNGVDVGF